MDNAMIKGKLIQKSRVRGVFTEKSQIVEFLKRIKKLDTSLSLVVSGIATKVPDAYRETGLKSQLH